MVFFYSFSMRSIDRLLLLCSSLISPYIFGLSEFHCHHPSLFMSYSPFVIPLPPMTCTYAAIYNTDNPEVHFSFSRLTHAFITCTSSPGGLTGTLNSIYTKLTLFSFLKPATPPVYAGHHPPSIYCMCWNLDPSSSCSLILNLSHSWTLPAKCLSGQFFSSLVPNSVPDTLGYVFCCLDFSPY